MLRIYTILFSYNTAYLTPIYSKYLPYYLYYNLLPPISILLPNFYLYLYYLYLLSVAIICYLDVSRSTRGV